MSLPDPAHEDSANHCDSPAWEPLAYLACISRAGPTAVLKTSTHLVDGGTVAHGVDRPLAAHHSQVLVRQDGPEVPLRPLGQRARELRSALTKDRWGRNARDLTSVPPIASTANGQQGWSSGGTCFTSGCMATPVACDSKQPGAW